MTPLEKKLATIEATLPSVIYGEQTELDTLIQTYNAGAIAFDMLCFHHRDEVEWTDGQALTQLHSGGELLRKKNPPPARETIAFLLAALKVAKEALDSLSVGPCVDEYGVSVDGAEYGMRDTAFDALADLDKLAEERG